MISFAKLISHFFLIFLWQGLIPPSAHIARGVGVDIHLFNPGYSLLIIFVAVFPFVFSKKLNLENLKGIIFLKKNILLMCFFFSYLIIAVFFGDFENLRIEGKGAFHKISLLLIKETNLRLFITTIFFFLSLIFILIVFENLSDRLVILFLVSSSLFIFPFYQEYLDPLIYVLIFSNFPVERSSIM